MHPLRLLNSIFLVPAILIQSSGAHHWSTYSACKQPVLASHFVPSWKLAWVSPCILQGTGIGAMAARKQQNCRFSEPLVGLVKHAAVCCSACNFRGALLQLHMSLVVQKHKFWLFLFLHLFPVCSISKPAATATTATYQEQGDNRAGGAVMKKKNSECPIRPTMAVGG